MLKIPVAGDQPLPLLLPQPQAEPGADAVPQRTRIRRKRHPLNAPDHAWDSAAQPFGQARPADHRQTRWLLLGGAALVGLLVAIVLLVMRRGDESPAGGGVPALGPPAAAHATAPPTLRVAIPAAEAALLAQAESLVRRFLTTTRSADLLSLVVNPAVAADRLRRFYPAGEIAAPGLLAFNLEDKLLDRTATTIFKVRTGNYEVKSIACVATSDGLKIDWESWVGWSEMAWSEFLAARPATARVFRLTLSTVDYYNLNFADDKKWQAYQLISPDGQFAIYGYAERGSAVNAQLPPSNANPDHPMTLALKFPPAAAAHNQVLIEQVLADGWVLAAAPPP